MTVCFLVRMILDSKEKVELLEMWLLLCVAMLGLMVSCEILLKYYVLLSALMAALYLHRAACTVSSGTHQHQ